MSLGGHAACADLENFQGLSLPRSPGGNDNNRFRFGKEPLIAPDGKLEGVFAHFILIGDPPPPFLIAAAFGTLHIKGVIGRVDDPHHILKVNIDLKSRKCIKLFRKH